MNAGHVAFNSWNMEHGGDLLGSGEVIVSTRWRYALIAAVPDGPETIVVRGNVNAIVI